MSVAESVRERAKQSLGSSNDAVYAMVTKALQTVGANGALLDVGCGSGQLWRWLGRRDHSFRIYWGADVIEYDGFPANGVFVALEPEAGLLFANGSLDTVVAVETIEHVDGPRKFFSELVRVLRPGGWLVVTTPNQLSAASLLSLIARGHFAAFCEAPGAYPSHITALLPIDLLRLANEHNLSDTKLVYSNSGRIPFTSRTWPRLFRGKWWSDNVALVARKPS